MPAVMLQGTGSDVGKSVLVAAVCRALANRGHRVLPFKPQNMSNNAAATASGEIGRAQALQALACRVEPDVDMNPVLIKPQSDRGAQLVVRGRVRASIDAAYYRGDKPSLLGTVLDSYRALAARAEFVIIEGAGSPAETNLRAGDIANMGFARAANVPVILVGDIDRGGVIASLVGTRTVLSPEDAALVRGFIINKFRGEMQLFAAGLADIERLTGWPSLGVVPWLAAARALPAEDAVVLDSQRGGGAPLLIAVPLLARIANFDDFDALRAESGVRLEMVPPGSPLPAEAAVVILPGSKSTLADLQFFRQQGWHIDLAAHVRRGGHVLGICGGYQMLGATLADPEGLEGVAGTVDGLGYLPVHTRLQGDKRVRAVHGTHLATNAAFEGYEIHVGHTAADAPLAPLLRFADGTTDGATSADGRIAGCYVHGLFDHPGFRTAWLGSLGVASDGVHQRARVDAALDELAHAIGQSLDLGRILEIASGAG